jgi:hypothetical protein
MGLMLSLITDPHLINIKMITGALQETLIPIQEKAEPIPIKALVLH